MPLSDVNREWFADQAEKQLAMGQQIVGKADSRAQMMKLARSAPYYKRNQAHVCSFFLKGECKRGVECPYR
jgi:pre-mRNA-splicing factor RBM22/SLT11